ncbi:MAG: FprA family A-type flavoprotein [Prevotellaceae bacterium]|jgi:flavorubredoxin|nr:FprA family A-type flavoprotein [Prevotellaceae bacterium]
MISPIKITDRVYYLGVNDRRKHLFENMWPLPQGVAYNSYLIVDEKTALIDTIECTVAADYIERIAAHLKGRKLDYLVVNHMEPDHAGMLGALVAYYPELKIVGNNKTFKILEGFFGITDNLIEVTDGGTLDLGHHKLQFVLTPWVHWPETMVTYDTTEQILFSADAFGSFGTLDGGIFDDEINFDFYESEMRRYYSNIVGKYSGMVQKALTKLKGTPVRIICSTHGPIWRSESSKVINLYDKWSRHESDPGVVVAFASMYGHTEQMADYVARRLAEQGVRDIRVFDVSKTHVSFLINEIWKYKGLILGSCAYNSEMHPMMSQLCNELLHISIKNKELGIFGSSSWNGAGSKALQAFAEASKLPLVAPVAEAQGKLTPDKAAAYDALAVAMAGKIQGGN